MKISFCSRVNRTQIWVYHYKEGKDENKSKHKTIERGGELYVGQLNGRHFRSFGGCFDQRCRQVSGEGRPGRDKFVVTQEGKVGVGTSIPEQDFDVVAPNKGLLRFSNTDADNTTKASRMVLRHYSNAQLPVYLFGAASTASANFVAFGGGSTIGNAATQLDLFTAENTTTPVGTPRMTIKSNGNVGIGTQNPTQSLADGGRGLSTAGAVGWMVRAGSTRKRLKTLNTQEAIETLKDLNPVNYAYKTTDREARGIYSRGGS